MTKIPSSEIPVYNSLVLEYIMAEQRKPLMARFGPGFESKLHEIFPSTDSFLNYIDGQLDKEFKELTDEKIEIEVALKNSAFEEVKNATKFEFQQYKSLLNMAEVKFRRAVNPEFVDQIPYSATLFSFDPDAEILTYESLDKPIIFFHGGLFSANLMFCKLYVQLIKDTKGDDALPNYTNLFMKDACEDLSVVTFNACYFYNYYFSSISDMAPGYDLKSPFEKNILATFLESIAFFIYAHETGHRLLNHPLVEDNERPTEQKWRDEFEADHFAMIHLRNYCGISSSNIMTLLGPLVFFRFRDLLEKFNLAYAKKDSHPPTSQRIEKYINFLKKNIHVNDRQILENFLNLESQIFKFLSDNFDKIHETAERQFPNKFN